MENQNYEIRKLDANNSRLTNVKSENNHQRPISVYDNFGENNTPTIPEGIEENEDDTGEQPQDEIGVDTKMIDRDAEVNENGNSNDTVNPSLTYCLNTTVPQNITAVKISGRHAPTRNSLRHSRMIVRTFTEKYTSPREHSVRRLCILRTSLNLQLIFGSVLIILALLLLIWVPTMSIHNHTYWSGLPLLLSGIIGICTIGCCCEKSAKDSQSDCGGPSCKIQVTLGTIAFLACIASGLFAVVNVITLDNLICESEIPNSTCVCRASSTSSDNNTTYRYAGINCAELYGTFRTLLISSSVFNGLSALVAFIYVYFICKREKRQRNESYNTDFNQT